MENKKNNSLNKPTGLKIDFEYENPLDAFLIKINQLLNPLWYSLNFTPNTLTTISLLLGCLGIYFVYQKKYILGALIYMLAYFFDCADGNYARTYNMQTKFGDYYDHICDLFKVVLLFYYIYNTKEISRRNKIVFLIMFGLIGIMNGIHMGCQQKIYDEKQSVLNLFKKFCYNTKIISITRYFGIGTLQLFMCSYIAAIPYMK